LFWKDILKGTDFVRPEQMKDPRAMGQYSPMDPNFGGPVDEFLDSLNEPDIRINPTMIYKYLTNKLGREPTDEEFRFYTRKVIEHESIHAGVNEALDFEMNRYGAEANEYLANMLMHPNDPYLGLVTAFKHRVSWKDIPFDMGRQRDLDPETDMRAFFSGRELKPTARGEELQKVITYIQSTAKNLKDRNLLASLELSLKKHNPNNIYPKNLNEAVRRYRPLKLKGEKKNQMLRIFKRD